MAFISLETLFKSSSGKYCEFCLNIFILLIYNIYNICYNFMIFIKYKIFKESVRSTL